MKKIYPAFFPVIFLLFTACKKDKPDAYNNLLAGKTWELVNYEGSVYYQGTPFTNGYFSFKPNGSCEYQEINGGTYSGTWYHVYHDDLDTHGLYIDVKEQTTGEHKAEYYDDIKFTTDYTFVAYRYTSISVSKFWFELKN